MQSDVRKLRPDDLDAVVALDRSIVGRSRRGYFEKRLAAALREPAAHIQFAHEVDGEVAGVVLARVLDGEFGRDQATVALEVIDVDHKRRGHGIGDTLLAALEAETRRRKIPEIQTEAAWSDHSLLGFFAAGGFELAPRQVLRRDLADAGQF